MQQLWTFVKGPFILYINKTCSLTVTVKLKSELLYSPKVDCSDAVSNVSTDNVDLDKLGGFFIIIAAGYWDEL